ncbi:acyl-CoA N-acyltransferase [Phascolomyces articulosus]|uniref:Acyl-CoA N-acyltransferase n=1 Tax=Phascolomyces articulosus TaxID=60185 RepID=A0AAD5PBF5_9FUNG|nr:acyl-CoA N-acyltransferase [Phascolomyces articulosus]
MTAQDNIIIREVTIDDLKYVKEAVAVVNSAYSTNEGWTSEEEFYKGDRAGDEELEKSIRENGVSCRLLFAFDVIDEKEKLIGTLRVDPVISGEKGHGEIRLFSIAPAYQSRGVGGRLVRFALTHMQELGYTACVMRVFEARTVLLNWYKKMGFAETGERIEFHDQERLKVKGTTFITLQKSF